MSFLRYIFAASFLLLNLGMCVEPNPPAWVGSVAGGGVLVFDPATPGPNAADIAAVFAINGGSPDLGQWSEKRYALLFKPGVHAYDVNVGYYTSVIGLGETPDDTTIGDATGGGVICEEGNLEDFTVGALNTFWRSAENFKTEPNGMQGWEWADDINGFLWAVSQACPLRRVHVTGPNPNLYLYEYVKDSGDAGTGFASGGFMANCVVDGIIDSGSQQQWLARNSEMATWPNGVWNMVFLGCTGAPPTNCGSNPFVNVGPTPVIAEKPYITYDVGMDKYFLQVPPVESNTVGSSSATPTTIDFADVFVAKETDSAATINGKLGSGLHVVLSAGNYNLTEPIVVNNPNTVVLGIGFPTLISASGNPCMIVGGGSGIRIGGILLQAGETNTPTLLQWGNPGDSPNNGFLYDCFARVGGTNNPTTEPELLADIMVVINSSNIICDNLWLWRADHYENATGTSGGLVMNGQNPCQNGFIANGDNIIAYALAPEHTLQDQCIWNGQNGQTYFFQCEYPYGVTSSYAQAGYVAYRVGTHVTSHLAYGVGVYSAFRDHPVTVNTAVSTPLGTGLNFNNSLTVFLDGNGGINHVINNVGDAVNSANGGPVYLCDPLPPVGGFQGGAKVRGRRFP